MAIYADLYACSSVLRFENKAALGLLMRFVANGREADGCPTRERLKIIAR
jgi:hypothetical protein